MVFVMIPSKGSSYHLTQNTSHKVQALGLSQLYTTDEDVFQFCAMLDGIALFSVKEVQEVKQHLNVIALHDAEELVAYFDQNYVSQILVK